jgi:hypothetical protein
VSIAAPAGVQQTCLPGCRWEVTVVTFGRDTHGDWIDRRCAPSLVVCLPHVPIGFFHHAGGLTHRPGGLIQRHGDTLDAPHVVGIIEAAWTTPDGVNARIHLATEAAWLARGLLRMERDRVLHVMGLSIDATADVWTWLHPPARARRILSIGRVHSVDFVSSAAGAKCFVRRRLPCPHPWSLDATATPDGGLTMLGLRKTPTPERAATPAEVLTRAEAELVKTTDALAVARQALADLRTAIVKEREAYLDASATALLDAEERPSRERLTTLELQVPDAEDLVERFAAALTKAEQRARHAKADVLDEQAAAVREETARRQARLAALMEQIRLLQQEAHEHGGWIGNAGPVRTQQLEAEAWRLRNAP